MNYSGPKSLQNAHSASVPNFTTSRLCLKNIITEQQQAGFFLLLIFFFLRVQLVVHVPAEETRPDCNSRFVY